MDMGRSVELELGGGADGKGRNTESSYLHRKGELAGILKLVLLWHAIGHPVCILHCFYVIALMRL